MLTTTVRSAMLVSQDDEQLPQPQTQSQPNNNSDNMWEPFSDVHVDSLNENRQLECDEFLNCDKCEDRFINFKELCSHRAQHFEKLLLEPSDDGTTSENHIIDNVVVSFSSEASNNHRDSIDLETNEQERLQCDKCDEDFLCFRDLCSHRATHFEKYEQNVCKVCGFNFQTLSESDMDQHDALCRRHENLENCEFCGMTVLTANCLCRHTLTLYKGVDMNGSDILESTLPIINQLPQTAVKSYPKQYSSDDCELRATSTWSTLHKILKKSVGKPYHTKTRSRIRIMKSVTIPNIACETIQPIPQDRLQVENVMFSLQGPQPEHVNQPAFLPNPQPQSFMTFMRNNHLEHLEISQGDDTSRENPLVSTDCDSMTETGTSWTSDNEECKIDIEYETWSSSDITIDPIHSELEPSDFPQQNDLIGQISTKLEVGGLFGVTEFSDALQNTTSATEDPPRAIRQRKGKSPRYLRPSQRPKECEECGKVLSTTQTYTNHVMTFHQRQFKFQCNFCSYGTQSSSNLQRHILLHSVNSETFKCSGCNGVFMSKLSRSIHLSKCYCVQQYRNQ